MNLPTDAVPSRGPSDDASEEEAARRAAQEAQMRKDVLARILEPAARERCKLNLPCATNVLYFS